MYILKLTSLNLPNFNIPELTSLNSPNVYILKLTSPKSPNFKFLFRSTRISKVCLASASTFGHLYDFISTKNCISLGNTASEYDIDVTVIYHGWSLDTDDLIQNHHLISQSHIYWIVWDMSISDNLAYFYTKREKAEVYLQLPRKSSWKFHPKINHGVGLGLLSPFVCICVSSAAICIISTLSLFRSYCIQLKNINKCKNAQKLCQWHKSWGWNQNQKKYLKFHAKITIAFVSLIFEHLECDVNYGIENSNRCLKKPGK